MYYCSSEVLFFFFKQKTAYEMRISDWSSDVCSSDLRARTADGDIDTILRIEEFDLTRQLIGARRRERHDDHFGFLALKFIYRPDARRRRQGCGERIYLHIIGRNDKDIFPSDLGGAQIGRASCRERVCQYV